MGVSTWKCHCPPSHLPLRFGLLRLLLATGYCIQRAWHTAHHHWGAPRTPGCVVGTIELQGALGEVGLSAYTRHPMQAKGVLLPLGQQPGDKIGHRQTLPLCCWLPLAPPYTPTCWGFSSPFLGQLLPSKHTKKCECQEKGARLRGQQGPWRPSAIRESRGRVASLHSPDGVLLHVVLDALKEAQASVPRGWEARVACWETAGVATQTA